MSNKLIYACVKAVFVLYRRSCIETKKGYGQPVRNPLKSLEAAIRVELMNNGFADHCLSHLATPPYVLCTGMRPFFIPYGVILTRGKVQHGNKSQRAGYDKQGEPQRI
jgi:hypothetical protein